MSHISSRPGRAFLLSRSALAGVGLSLGLALLSACSSLPSSGPSAGEVTDRFDPKEAKPDANPMGVRLVDLSPNVAEAVEHAPRPSLRKIEALRSNAYSDRIGPGDILSISVYESGPGLFGQGRSLGATDATSQGGSSAAGVASMMSGVASSGTTSESLPHLLVDRQGRITVPYIGQVPVAGRTPAEVQTQLQALLRGKATEAQVLVNVSTSDTNMVFVSGDVKQSGRVPLTLAGENLLDVIAMTGGPTHPAQDMVVKVTRHGAQAQTLLTNIQTIADENIRMEPHDRIQVDYVPRTFLVFGAAGKVAQYPFESARVSLAEAVARGGGLDDQRADPQAVFLFRYESPFVAHALDQPADRPLVPIIYRVNMRDPQSFFLLQRFAMQDKDMIYVANARTVQLYKFLQLISSFLTPVTYSAVLSNYR